MRLLLTILALFCLTGSAVMAAPQPIKNGHDIARPVTTKAILTLSQAQGDMRALMFGNVLNLKTCLGLAVAATQNGWRESSATCLDPQGRAVASYFCGKGEDGTRCHIRIPDL